MDLDAEEVRVLGCLVEKELATPQSYPLSLNSLQLACNQSTNRDPVVSYDEHQVEGALGRLRQRGLTRVVHSRSNRVPKYRHVLDEVWDLDRPQLAVLAVLALRGPQTLGELKQRTERMSPFSDLGAVEAVLAQLASHHPEPLAVRLDRLPGQKDARYASLIGTDAPGPTASHPAPATLAHGGAGETPDPGWEPSPSPSTSPVSRVAAGHQEELTELREHVDRLSAEIAELRSAFETFRDQFA